jgi:hypothetical protein
MALSMNAQEISKNALGLRLGDSDGFGTEISYQTALGGNNRLELDLGWRDANRFNAFRLTGVYQWVMPIENRFNWFVGVGGGIGSVDYDNAFFPDSPNSEVFVFAAGDIGIEYNFNIPLILSLDFRPEIGFIDNFNNNLDFDIAFGIRYQFN